jgi:hypothetical protein
VAVGGCNAGTAGYTANALTLPNLRGLKLGREQIFVAMAHYQPVHTPIYPQAYVTTPLCERRAAWSSARGLRRHSACKG